MSVSRMLPDSTLVGNDKSAHPFVRAGEDLVEKVGQHKHCKQCEKAIPYKSEFCDETCESAWKSTMGSKKRQLTYFYIIMVIIMVLAISLTFLG